MLGDLLSQKGYVKRRNSKSYNKRQVKALKNMEACWVCLKAQSGFYHLENFETKFGIVSWSIRGADIKQYENTGAEDQ